MSQQPWWLSPYGPDDQIGMLNEITPFKVVEAAHLVQHGQVYDLGYVLDEKVPAFPGRSFRQHLTTSAHLLNRRRPDAGSIGWGENNVNWVLIPVDFYLGTQFPYNTAHQMGTMKMGTDAQTSILNPYCRPHDLENVFVTDGSFMVSSGAVNPTLTIIAQTLRVANFIKTEVF